MDSNSLTNGDSVAGLLVDGTEGTPYVGASLKIDSDRGILLQIPYIDHPEVQQFKHVNEWFKNREMPLNMILQTVEGDLGLFGNRWKGYKTTNTQSLGTVVPSELLIGEYEGDLSDPLLLDEVRTRIDGLAEWTSIRSIDFSHVTDDQGLIKELSVNAKPIMSDTWRQGEATMHFVSEWKTSYPNQEVRMGLNIDEGTVLVSQFENPRPFKEHLNEQRKIRHLLTLLSGIPLHFRQHKASSSEIVEKSAVGRVIRKPRNHLISSETIMDYFQPVPHSQDFKGILAHFDELGVKGLEAWSEKYDLWGPKFIFPAVALMSREKVFVEDTVNTLSMTIEAAGMILGKQPEEESTYSKGKNPSPTTSTYFYRCLRFLGTEWGEIAPNYEALARGLAKTYNATKHYNKGQYPAPEVLTLAGKTLTYLVRLIALHLADTTGQLLEQFKTKPGPLRLAGWHRHLGVSFDESGRVVPFVAGQAKNTD